MGLGQGPPAGASGLGGLPWPAPRLKTLTIRFHGRADYRCQTSPERRSVGDAVVLRVYVCEKGGGFDVGFGVQSNM